MTRRLLALTLLAGGSMFGQVSVGIRIGAPPPPRVVRYRPSAPGPDFFWVDGYWYVVNGRYVWHQGYWSRPPYPAARWVAPRHDGERYYDGYWEGDRGRFDHDHRWDRDRDRDWREKHHDRDHDRDHDRR